MSVLNLRNVPDDLMRKLRSSAALHGEQFHSYCIRQLAAAVDDTKPESKQMVAQATNGPDKLKVEIT